MVGVSLDVARLALDLLQCRALTETKSVGSSSLAVLVAQSHPDIAPGKDGLVAGRGPRGFVLRFCGLVTDAMVIGDSIRKRAVLARTSELCALVALEAVDEQF